MTDKCEGKESQIHRLVEKELDLREERELVAHLSVCPSCQERLKEYHALKSVLEERLDAGITLSDESAFIREVRTAGGKNSYPNAKRTIKKGLLAFAAGLAAIVFSGFIFGYFYFAKTFPHELSNMVLRCSGNIKIRSGGDQWNTLKVAYPLREGAKLLTPEGSSFLSFNGIRLLTEAASGIEIKGHRKLLIEFGAVSIETAKDKEPLELMAGAAVVSTPQAVLKITGRNDAYKIACIAGDASVSSGGERHHLAPGEEAAVAGGDIKVSASSVENPFFSVSALERARARFEEVIAQYAQRMPAMDAGKRMDFGRETTASYLSDGIRFVSYDKDDGDCSPRLAQTIDPAAVGDYYERLFVPSNRSISMGRQKLIPVKPGNATPFPIWSHDGSMIAYSEYYSRDWPTVVKVARLDDLEHPWRISQDYNTVLPHFPIAWTPDDKRLMFLAAHHMEVNREKRSWYWKMPWKIKIAPVDPSEAPVEEFQSPFTDLPVTLPVPVGKTLSPVVLKLPWGDAILCVNWGNLAYVPIEENGQAVEGAPGVFLTSFNPSVSFVWGGLWSPSGNKILFTASRGLNFDHMNVYILHDVEDILDGFAEAPRSLEDPRIKQVAPAKSVQIPGGFSYDESLVFFAEDVNQAWRSYRPINTLSCDFDLFYANALPGQPGAPVQIHLPGNQMYLNPSPEGNRIVYRNSVERDYELRVVSFDIDADIDNELGGVLIDNSGSNLIVPPGALQKNFNVKISTPFDIKDEAELTEGEDAFFAMRLISAEGMQNPQFVEPMTLTIRYTDDEVAGLDEGMLEIYYYDESEPNKPVWVPLGGTVDPEHNEITVEIRHFSKFCVGESAQ